jgi:hypothetical protein
MLMKLQRYDLRIVYVPGKEMYISDTLSRAFLSDNNDEFDVSFGTVRDRLSVLQ